MSKTRKQTDKVEEQQQNQFAVTQRKFNTARIKCGWPCLTVHVYIWCNSFYSCLLVATVRLTAWYSLISHVIVAEKPLRCGCIYKCRHLLCGRFGSRYTQISFTTINKQLWPICHAPWVPALTHSAVIYSLLLPAMRAVDELGIKPEDSNFSSLTGWTGAGRCITLQAPLMDSLQHQQG